MSASFVFQPKPDMYFLMTGHHVDPCYFNSIRVTYWLMRGLSFSVVLLTQVTAVIVTELDTKLRPLFMLT